MKIAFPVEEDLGLDSPVFGHFGSAPFFLIVDAETEQTETVANQNLDHGHGACQPLLALNNKPVDAVVVGGIGGGALAKLNAAGIDAFRGVSGSVGENLTLAGAGRLPRFTMNQTCQGDREDGRCAHERTP